MPYLPAVSLFNSITFLDSAASLAVFAYPGAVNQSEITGACNAATGLIRAPGGGSIQNSDTSYVTPRKEGACSRST